MPKTRSAIRQLRKSKKRRLRNQSYMSWMRTSVKKARLALEGENLDEAKAAIRDACRIIDKTASAGVIKKNTAARYKSRLMKRLAQLIPNE